VEPGAGSAHALAADRFTLKLHGTEEHAPYCLFEYEAASGMPGPPPHVHHSFEEAWFILAGEVEFTLASGSRAAGPGSFLWVPRGVVHTFRVRGPSPARWIGILSPGRHVAMLAELGGLLRSGEPPDSADLAEFFRRHDSDIVLPAVEAP
jgi:mannose-6-phosphate isomerase-like protein (cupin superfamily)